MSRISQLLNKAQGRKVSTSGNRKFPPISQDILKRLEEMQTNHIPHEHAEFDLGYDYDTREFIVEDTYTGEILIKDNGRNVLDWCYEQLHPERKEGTEHFLTKEQLRETEVNSKEDDIILPSQKDIIALEDLFANKDTKLSDVEDMSEDIVKIDDSNYQYFTNSVPSASIYYSPNSQQVEIVFFDKNINSEGQEYYQIDEKDKILDFMKKNTESLDELELVNALKYMETIEPVDTPVTGTTPEETDEELEDTSEALEDETIQDDSLESKHNVHTKEFLDSLDK